MTDLEFNDKLQVELRRVNDLNRDLERQIIALQTQAEKMMEKIKAMGGSMEDGPPPVAKRRRPFYA